MLTISNSNAKLLIPILRGIYPLVYYVIEPLTRQGITIVSAAFLLPVSVNSMGVHNKMAKDFSLPTQLGYLKTSYKS